MVLKVVRAKILEKLELSRVLPFVFARIDRLPKRLSAVKDRSFSDHDYLVDNRCLRMLSQVGGQINGKAVAAIDPVPIWECRS